MVLADNRRTICHKRKKNHRVYRGLQIGKQNVFRGQDALSREDDEIQRHSIAMNQVASNADRDAVRAWHVSFTE